LKIGGTYLKVIHKTSSRVVFDDSDPCIFFSRAPYDNASSIEIEFIIPKSPDPELEKGEYFIQYEGEGFPGPA